MDGLEPITLVVKAPNQKVADKTIECSLDWTVGHLKKHLSAVYPSQPQVNQQRLIYSGQLLQDNSKLKDILKQYEPNQTIHTVHLVCSSSTSDTVTSISKQTEGLRNRKVNSGATFSETNVSVPDVPSEAVSNNQGPRGQGSTITNQGSANIEQSGHAAAVQTNSAVDASLYNFYYNLYHQQAATSQSVFVTAASPGVNRFTQSLIASYPSAYISPSVPQYHTAASPYPAYFPVAMMNNNYRSSVQTPGSAAVTAEIVGTVPAAAGVGSYPTAAASYPAVSTLAMQASHWMTNMQLQQQQQQILQQQLYTEYFNRFMQHFQAAGSTRQPILIPTPSVPGATQPAPQPMAPEAPQAARGPAEPQAVRMNAQGGPVLDDEDEEEGNRDWLDWIYTFIRFSMLLCILYFYSTFTRFIAALCVIVVFYMYQAGWFRMQRRDRRQPNVAQRQQQQHQNGQVNADIQNVGADARGNEDDTTAAPVVADNQPGALMLAWNFFISFFLSLAPQAPPAVNAN